MATKQQRYTHFVCGTSGDYRSIDGGNNHYRVTKINRKGAEYDGQQLILVDGGKYKDIIARRLQKENGIGSCMVHADCDLEYAKQLTAEHKVAEGSGQKAAISLATKSKSR